MSDSPKAPAKPPNEIEVNEWWRPGNGWMVHASALGPDHPGSYYGQIVAMGLRPEDYGITRPPEPRCCPNCGHSLPEDW